jgi:hypothetical protein
LLWRFEGLLKITGEILNFVLKSSVICPQLAISIGIIFKHIECGELVIIAEN